MWIGEFIFPSITSFILDFDDSKTPSHLLFVAVKGLLISILGSLPLSIYNLYVPSSCSSKHAKFVGVLKPRTPLFFKTIKPTGLRRDLLDPTIFCEFGRFSLKIVDTSGLCMILYRLGPILNLNSLRDIRKNTAELSYPCISLIIPISFGALYCWLHQGETLHIPGSLAVTNLIHLLSLLENQYRAFLFLIHANRVTPDSPAALNPLTNLTSSY